MPHFATSKLCKQICICVLYTTLIEVSYGHGGNAYWFYIRGGPFDITRRGYPSLTWREFFSPKVKPESYFFGGRSRTSFSSGRTRIFWRNTEKQFLLRPENIFLLNFQGQKSFFLPFRARIFFLLNFQGQKIFFLTFQDKYSFLIFRARIFILS